MRRAVCLNLGLCALAFALVFPMTWLFGEGVAGWVCVVVGCIGLSTLPIVVIGLFRVENL